MKKNSMASLHLCFQKKSHLAPVLLSPGQQATGNRTMLGTRDGDGSIRGMRSTLWPGCGLENQMKYCSFLDADVLFFFGWNDICCTKKNAKSLLSHSVFFEAEVIILEYIFEVSFTNGNFLQHSQSKMPKRVLNCMSGLRLWKIWW